MKAATVVGILLIVAGFIGFAMGGFTFTHEKKDVDLGPIQVEHQQKKTVPIPPILSVIAMVGRYRPCCRGSAQQIISFEAVIQ